MLLMSQVLLALLRTLLWFASRTFFKIFIYESSMPKDMTCARMRKYIELRDKL